MVTLTVVCDVLAVLDVVVVVVVATIEDAVVDVEVV